MNGSKAILITGPAGSGKSTLAEHISHKLGWECISEDEYWVRNGWGEGLRTEEQEAIVQQQVAEDLLAMLQLGKSAVLEFILYKTPPNPLTAYQELLENNSIDHHTIALKPSIDEIIARQLKRGRPNDISHTEEKRTDAQRQLDCIDFESNESTSIIDTSDMSVEELTEKCLQIISIA